MIRLKKTSECQQSGICFFLFFITAGNIFRVALRENESTLSNQSDLRIKQRCGIISHITVYCAYEKNNYGQDGFSCYRHRAVSHHQTKVFNSFLYMIHSVMLKAGEKKEK